MFCVVASGQYHFGFSSVFAANTSSFLVQSVFKNSISSPVGSKQTSTDSTFGTQTGTFCVLPPRTPAFKSPFGSLGASPLPAPCGSMFGQQPINGASGSNLNQSSPFGSSNAFHSSSAFGIWCYQLIKFWPNNCFCVWFSIEIPCIFWFHFTGCILFSKLFCFW